MSEIKLPLRRLNLVLALLTCFLSIFAADNNYIGSYTQDEIEQKLKNLNADVDLKLTPEVKKYLRDYVVSYRQSSEKLIGRSLIYFPNIENKLSEKLLPSEIKYLSVIESSLKPDARSRVGAVGLWQFMKATAKMYGLSIDKHVDERKDVEKSTEAALEYLSDLHERFGDWTLALAAYNCGPGNVRKAMRRSGGHDYWSIRSFLPRETRNYVPKFIAVTYLMNYYSDHDLEPDYPEALFIKTRKVHVYEPTHFSTISKLTGLSVEEITDLNPSYVGTYIPRSKEGNILELPTEKMYAYLEATQTFENLVPDPLQDLKSETQVASQVLTKRTFIEIQEIPSTKTLAQTQLIYVPKNIELKPDVNWIRRREESPKQTNQEKRKVKRKQFADRVSAAYIMR